MAEQIGQHVVMVCILLITFYSLENISTQMLPSIGQIHDILSVLDNGFSTRAFMFIFGQFLLIIAIICGPLTDYVQINTEDTFILLLLD